MLSRLVTLPAMKSARILHPHGTPDGRLCCRPVGQCQQPGNLCRLHQGERHRDGRRQAAALELSAQGALDAAPPEYVAPMYAYLVSDLAAKVTGQIFIAAGNFVGRFDRPAPSLLGYRDHHDSSPWSVDDIAAMLA